MIVEYPKLLDVTLTHEEQDTITKCLTLLDNLQTIMANHDCTTLKDDLDQRLTYGDIDDIASSLNIICDICAIFDD